MKMMVAVMVDESGLAPNEAARRVEQQTGLMVVSVTRYRDACVLWERINLGGDR